VKNWQTGASPYSLSMGLSLIREGSKRAGKDQFVGKDPEFAVKHGCSCTWVLLGQLGCKLGCREVGFWPDPVYDSYNIELDYSLQDHQQR